MYRYHVKFFACLTVWFCGVVEGVPVNTVIVPSEHYDEPDNITTTNGPSRFSTKAPTALAVLTESTLFVNDSNAIDSNVHEVAITTSPTTKEPETTTTSLPSTTDRPVDVTCLPLSMMGQLDHLTQEQFTQKLTDSCRYDRLIIPRKDEPLNVIMQIDFVHVESSDPQQMKAYILVQLSYDDERLRFDKISPKRVTIQGEAPLRNKIWVPHLTIKNERASSLMGLDGKDVMVRISPQGRVTYSYRMTLTFYCWMNLQKFPFDSQVCEIVWVSWSDNVKNLILNWDPIDPAFVAPSLHLTEYVMDRFWTETTVKQQSLSSTGSGTGNFSSLIFKFKLKREVGYYILDFFLPSMFLVLISWVTFWLQADAGPPRAVLGTSTMLSLITLNGGVTKNLPKVSYIKASEIWFLACFLFIFASLAEFAFVNVIWRRKKHVEVKKPSGKYILKGAVTPSLARKQLRAESLNSLHKTRSCTSLDERSYDKHQISQNNYLTVHDFSSIQTLPGKNQNSHDNLINNSEESVTTIPVPENGSKPIQPTWTTMTPQDVANWIDRKSRIFFPLSFLVFNLIYWTFVYAID